MENKKDNEIREIEIYNNYKFLCIEDEEEDSSVNFYSPFCITFENRDNGKQKQIFMDYDVLIVLAKKLKPYLEDYEAREQAEQDFSESQKNDAIGTPINNDLTTAKGLVLPKTKPTATEKDLNKIGDLIYKNNSLYKITEIKNSLKANSEV